MAKSLSTFDVPSLENEAMGTPIEKINQMLSGLGMNQTELAESIGESSKSVHRWLTGKTKKPIPNVMAIIKIARVLGVPVEYLLDDSMDEPTHAALPIEEQSIAEVFRAFGEDRFFGPRAESNEEEMGGFDAEGHLRLLYARYLRVLSQKLREERSKTRAAHAIGPPAKMGELIESVETAVMKAIDPIGAETDFVPEVTPRHGARMTPKMKEILDAGQAAVGKKGKGDRKSG